jgi:hypothetical protein
MTCRYLTILKFRVHAAKHSLVYAPLMHAMRQRKQWTDLDSCYFCNKCISRSGAVYVKYTQALFSVVKKGLRQCFAFFYSAQASSLPSYLRHSL